MAPGRSWMRECGSMLNKMCSKFNKFLSYKSQKTVRVIDRRMGLMVLFLRIVILGYLAVAIYLSEAYKWEEHAVGALIAKGNGDTYSTDNHKQVRFWDYADALYPPTEVGAIFVATRVVRTNLQTIGTCANTAHPCSSKIVNQIESPSAGGKPADGSRRLMSLATPKPAPPPDTTDTPLKPGDDDGAKEDPSCSPGAENSPGVTNPDKPYATGKCAGDGKGCLEQIWCPSEGSSSLRTLDMKLETINNFKINFHSVISFPVFAPNEDPVQYSHKEMSLTEIIQEVGAEEEEVLENGAVISARVMYECDMDSTTVSDCEPKVKLRRLDNEASGFSYRRATYYYTDDDERARDVQRLVGVRVQLSCYGVAKQTSFLTLILQLSIGLTLLGLAGTITDWYMCNVCDDWRFYVQYKMEDSDDFSDLSERLQNLDPERQRFLLSEKRHRQAVAAKAKGKKRR